MAGAANGGFRGGPSGGGAVNFYKRVPKDLTEATTLGAGMSVCAICVMAVLFLSETLAFARTTVTTTIAPEADPEHQIRLNFNITFMDLKCEFVSLDVWDALGTNRQNVTKNIQKWQVDREGQKKSFAGRHFEPRDLKHDEHDETLEEMIKDGAYAKSLKQSEAEKYMTENEMVFIDFFAPWCKHCQRLAPTWEKFAQQVFNDGMPVGVATVDCTMERDLCSKYAITGYPTMQWFAKGEPAGPKYQADRTVDAIMAYAKQRVKTNERYKEWEADPARRERYKNFDVHGMKAQNPGCQVHGHLMVNRVPGNFHVEAKAKDHSIDPAMTNLSHVVNHISFGVGADERDRKAKMILSSAPQEHQKFTPLDRKTYSTTDFHQAYHHYVKVVPTVFDISDEPLTVYQLIGQSQVVFYDVVNVPEARFSYDLSPMTVNVSTEGRKWYDYITSLCAIIGGAFTTLGLIDAVLYKVFKPKKL